MTTTPKALPETREYKMHPDRCRVACSRESCTCAPNRFDWEARPLVDRLSDEADQCRNDGANDIAALLDEAVQALNARTPADSLASAGGVEVDRLRNALDHIRKVCVLSRTQSRRIRWIETRAHGALIGDDRLHRSIDLPKDGGPDAAEKLKRRMLQDRHTFRVAQGLAAGILSAALSKEREVADGLRAELDAAKRDAERYRWLRGRMVGADFDWNESGVYGLVFEMPKNLGLGSDCDENIDAAIEAAKEG